MTDEEINIKIAEACGWRIESSGKYDWVVFNPDGFEVGWSDSGAPMAAIIPSYCNDLNAMHEAEKTLLAKCDNDPQDDLWIDYLANLLLAAPCCLREHATARQRAEAFLRTLNLWTE